jgi:predicted metal-dependent hydrolase
MKTQITKSWRKTLSMRFDAHGVLHVKAPKFMLQYQIDAFIHKNSAWIEKHYTKIQQQKADKKYYLFGGEIAPSVLRTPPSTKEAQEAPSVLRTPPSSKEAYKKKFPLVEGGGNTTELVKFYKTQAKDYIIPRCEALAREHGFQYK